jgi:hypothetical protein
MLAFLSTRFTRTPPFVYNTHVMRQRTRAIMPYQRLFSQPGGPRRGKALLLLLIAGCLVLLIALGIKGWHIYHHAQQVRRDVHALTTFTPVPTDHAATIARLSGLLRNTRSSAQQLQAEAEPLLPITHYLGGVPSYGSDIAAADPLLDTLIHLTTGLEEAVTGLTPLVVAANETGTLSITHVIHLQTARPHLQRARQSLAAAQHTLTRVAVDDLSPDLRKQVEPLVPLLPLLDTTLNLALVGSETTAALLPVVDAWQQTQTLNSTLIANLHAARPTLQQAHQQLTNTQQRLDNLARQQLPTTLHQPLQQAEQMLSLADIVLALALAGDELARDLEPLLTDQPQNQQLTVALTNQLVAAQPHIKQVQQRMRQLDTTLDTLALDELPAPIRPRVQQVQEILPRLLLLSDLALVLDDLLGANGMRNYLLLALNPDELRGAGGFISAADSNTIHHGQFNQLAMHDSSAVDHQRLLNGPYIQPPEPLRRFMGLQQWAFRDATWSPDFRYSANAARYLYNLSQGTSISDVVAFTPQTLRYLLQATGPLTVTGADTPVTADNLLAYMRNEYNEQRRGSDSFVAPLLDALLARILTDADRPDPLVLAKMLYRALNERQLMLLIEEKPVADVLARLHWDGAVRPGNGDFLMVVDANVGYNKANARIAQTISYTVDLRTPARPFASLHLSYTHQNTRTMECWHWKPAHEKDADDYTYTNQMARCYWNYLRVLLPAGSQPQYATRHPTPAEWLITNQADAGATTMSRGVNGTTMLSTLLVVPSAAQRRMRYDYQLPARILQRDAHGNWHYHLKIQKQPGHEHIPVRVTIHLPAGATLVSASPQWLQHQSQPLTCTLSLSTDQQITLVFQAESE